MELILKNLPILVVITPLMMSLVVAVFSNYKISWILSCITTFITFCFSIGLFFELKNTNLISYHLGNWVPPFGIEYVIDSVSIIPVLVISFFSFIATIFSIKFFKNEIDLTLIPKTYCLWLLAIAGLIGLVTTADVFNLFVFLEISSLSSVALVAMGNKVDKKALPAAYNYLIIGAIGATLYVIGVGLLYSITGTLNMGDLSLKLPELGINKVVIAAFGFMIAGIMVKAAIFPLHIWLPSAYAFAPSPVSVLLAATATKASIYIIARISYTIFGGTFELYAIDDLKFFLILLSIFAMFAGTFMAIYEKDIKRLLAHSSVAQIGYILLGISLATSTGIASGFIHLVNHALIKGGLFMSVVAMGFYIQKRVTIHSFSGLGKQMPITFFSFIICGLSLAGLPLTAGFISKLYLVKAAYASEGIWLCFLILLSSVLSLIYLWKMIEALWFNQSVSKDKKIKEIPQIYIPLLFIAFLNIYFGIDATIITESSFNAAESLLEGINK